MPPAAVPADRPGWLVAADQAFWLPMCRPQLEATTDQLRLLDLRRAAATSGVTEAFLLDPDAHLNQIAAQVDDGWGEILHDRRRLMLEQVANVRSVAELAGLRSGPPFEHVAGLAAFPFQRRRFELRAPRSFPAADRAGGNVSDCGRSIAASGLEADSAELDTTSNNLSNIDTPGYTKEVVNLSPDPRRDPPGRTGRHGGLCLVARRRRATKPQSRS